MHAIFFPPSLLATGTPGSCTVRVQPMFTGAERTAHELRSLCLVNLVPCRDAALAAIHPFRSQARLSPY